MESVFKLVCSRCSKFFKTSELVNACHCRAPFLINYDLQAIAESWNRADLARSTETSLWRYAPVLPAERKEAITLMEGWTPLLPVQSALRNTGLEDLWIKDESRNPTGSIEARGFSCAATFARKTHLKKLVLSSTGNAALALAAYAAVAEIQADIELLYDTPQATFVECAAFGAKVKITNAAGKEPGKPHQLQEAYRLEGLKTVGFEIAEQLKWQLPDAVVCPCGDGAVFAAIWKAFAELETLGWIRSERPKMIAVQARGCAPVVAALEAGDREPKRWPAPHTVAHEIRVPDPAYGFLVLRAIRESKGTAIAASDEQMIEAAIRIGSRQGIFPTPECGACLWAVEQLFNAGFLQPNETVVIVNPGSGLNYIEAYSSRFPRLAASEQDKLGGLITPR